MYEKETCPACTHDKFTIIKDKTKPIYYNGLNTIYGTIKTCNRCKFQWS